MQLPLSLTDQAILCMSIGWRWRYRMITVFVLMILLTVLVMIFCPRKYASEARFLIRLGRESVGMDPTATATGPIVGVNESRESEIRSALEILNSRDVIESTVESLTPDVVLNPFHANPSKESESSSFDLGSLIGGTLETIGVVDPIGPNEKAVKELRESLEASIPTRSNIIVLTCESKTAEHAQELAAEVTKQFLQTHLKAHRTSQAVEFFQDQSNVVYSKLNHKNAELRRLKTDYGITSIDGRKNSLEEQIQNSKLLEQQLSADLAATTAKAKLLSRELKTLPMQLETENVVTASYAQQAMRDRLYELQIRQRELSAKLTKSHPLMESINEQLQDSQRILDSTDATNTDKTVTINPNRMPLELELLMERTRQIGLESQLDAVMLQTKSSIQQLEDFHSQAIEIEDLQREADILANNYQEYAKKLEQARIDRMLEQERISNISVIQAPNLVFKPSSPKKLLLGVAGLFFGTLGALGIAFVSNALERRKEIDRYNLATSEDHLEES
ncbi:MAG: hypothetical protein AAF483_13085 [Planctomycetota bacterium]